jgi:hypothetical protein
MLPLGGIRQNKIIVYSSGFRNILLIHDSLTITSADSIVQIIKQDAERWFNTIKQKRQILQK